MSIVALCGGVGGAKLAFGLAQALPPGDLSVIVNTGDDFEHLGLRMSPDLDTVLYTLAGLADRERGWGLSGESWGFMAALERLGGPVWFNLGDADLALHVTRTQRLLAGETLSAVTAALAQRLSVLTRILPMSDDPVHTWLDTDAGVLDFQAYFVRERCAPRVRSIAFEGAETAKITDAVRAALESDGLEAIVLCPSNPYLSLDPILALPELHVRLAARSVPCVAVSPIVGGMAIKGPAAKLMAELGVRPSSVAVAAHYGGLIDGLVVDIGDGAERAEIEASGVAVHLASSVMRSDADRVALAEATLAFAGALRR